MFPLTNYGLKTETIQTINGDVTLQDWLLDEMSRIKLAGGEAVMKQDGETVYLELTKLGPDFQKEKWPNCQDNNKIAKGVNR